MDYSVKLLRSNVFYAFISALVCSFFVYGFELTHFTLSIDEEFLDNFYQTIALGRWGHSFLRYYILPEPYVPFFTTIISLFFLSASAAVSTKIADLDKKYSIIFSVVYVAIPQFAYQLEFSNQSDTVAIAIFLATISVFVFIKNNASLISLSSLLSLILYVFAISVYQSLSMLPVSLVLMFLFFKTGKLEISPKDSLIFLSKFALISIFSFFIYIIIAKSLQNHFGVNSGSYLSNMIGWGKMDSIYLVRRIIKSIYDFFSGDSYYGLLFFSLTPVAFVICAVMLFLKNGKLSLMPSLYALLMLLSPFILTMFFGGSQPPRTLTSLSVVESAIVVYALLLIGNNIFNIVVSLVVASYGSIAASQLFYSDYMSYQSDMFLANRIVNVINIKFPGFDSEKTKVYFYGAYENKNEWRKSNSDVFGNSFFSWDGGNNSRIISFMKRTGISYFNKVDEQSVSELRNNALSMPSWPNPESVKMINNMLVVKLGSKPGID